MTVRVREGIGRPTAPGVPDLEGQAGRRRGRTAATDNTAVAGYRVNRNGSQLASVDGSTMAFTDDTVVDGTSYTYAVAALDTSGNVGPAAAITVVTPGEAPPPDPGATPAPTPRPGHRSFG